MKILFAASEMAPFAKTGGLGDVVGSLPIILREHGIDARVVMPHYSGIRDIEYQFTYTVPRRQGYGDVTVHSTVYQGVPVYFLRSYPYFVDDGKIYTTWEWDTPRFIYFSQMIMAFIWELATGRANEGDSWWADVLHVHDWHTGLTPFLLHEARFNPGWSDIASVLTIHNMAFQGPHAGGWLFEEGIPNRDHPALRYQAWRDNLLAVGIAYADKLNTVSPRHATELHYPRFGEGLQDVIWARDADFTGILNGIDTTVFDPATDPHAESHYDADTFRQKRLENKLILQRRHNLQENADIPLIGLISRLTDQKGIDFAIPAIRHVLATSDAQFIGLGSGEPVLEREFGKIGMDFGWKARTYLMHNPDLAKQIYSGVDMLLVPSRYEPCGLTQMMAMRYGCLPIVRETGGLADTVENYDGGNADKGTGFLFLFEEAEALIGTVRWALETFRKRRDAWERMQERGMRQDWSWQPRVQEYIQMYEGAIQQKRAWKKT